MGPVSNCSAVVAGYPGCRSSKGSWGASPPCSHSSKGPPGCVGGPCQTKPGAELAEGEAGSQLSSGFVLPSATSVCYTLSEVKY